MERATHSKQTNRATQKVVKKRPQLVAVLDAGGQYVDLVKKACERLGYPASILPLDTPAGELKKLYKAVIISGSPASSQAVDAPMPDPNIWQLDLPVLGICYGLHAMVTALGGEVVRGTSRQDGRITTQVDTDHPLFKNVKPGFSALFTHGNFVSKLPKALKTIGQHQLPNGATVYSAVARGRILGVQFHPEVFDDTPEGFQVFKNFLGDVAQLKPDKTFLEGRMDKLIANLRAGIRKQAGDRHVIAFVSGGTDSSVMIALAATEIKPEKLHAYYINNGFMRDEDDEVIDLLKYIGVPVQKVEAAETFCKVMMQQNGKTVGPLNQTIDPQYKRQLIGKAFIDVQNELIASLHLKKAILLQGTNAADRIESAHSKGGQHTALIKTHHNQVQEVQDLKARGLLIEPLDELFKDEVRAVGRRLGLPDEVVDRQPFPGPGLAVRILCARGDEIEPKTQAIETAMQTYLDSRDDLKTTHTKAKLLPVRNVGVGGDERSHVAAVALESDASWETLGRLASDLPGVFRDEVNRVIVSLTDHPIQKFTITPTLLQMEAIKQLRHADRIVFEKMRRFEILNSITQFLVILLPLSFDKPEGRSIVLRPIRTTAFLTVQAMLPERDLPLAFVKTCAQSILQEVPGINQVFLDLTNKPPATVEWE